MPWNCPARTIIQTKCSAQEGVNVISTKKKVVFARFAIDSRRYARTSTSCMREFSTGRAHLQQGAHTRPIPRSVFAISTYKTNILNPVLDLTTEEERLPHICKCSLVRPKPSKSENSKAGYAVRNPISGNRVKLSVSGLSPRSCGPGPLWWWWWWQRIGHGISAPPIGGDRDDWILYALGGTLNPMGEALGAGRHANSTGIWLLQTNKGGRTSQCAPLPVGSFGLFLVTCDNVTVDH
jgi:hypothetical protein